MSYKKSYYARILCDKCNMIIQDFGENDFKKFLKDLKKYNKKKHKC